jgi:hypothetical protein
MALYRTGIWGHSPGFVWGPSSLVGGNVQLKTFQITNYRSVNDSGEIKVSSDVTNPGKAISCSRSKRSTPPAVLKTFLQSKTFRGTDD